MAVGAAEDAVVGVVGVVGRPPDPCSPSSSRRCALANLLQPVVREGGLIPCTSRRHGHRCSLLRAVLDSTSSSA
jgi:hypothetical protein